MSKFSHAAAKDFDNSSMQLKKHSWFVDYSIQMLYVFSLNVFSLFIIVFLLTVLINFEHYTPQIQ